MYGVFIEVNADESHVDAAKEFLPREAVPMARESGATAGFWLAPKDGRGVSIVVFNTEAEAQAVADHFEVGASPGGTAPAGVTVRSVEVREVLASV